jgi:hypothetical protein
MVTMADTNAQRQQRHRRHRAGDHSMCRKPCQDSRPSRKIAPVPAGSGRDLDPGAEMRDLAVQLREACRADPGNAVLAREYRNTLVLLMPSHDGAVDVELQALMREIGGLSKPTRGQEWPDWGNDRG